MRRTPSSFLLATLLPAALGLACAAPAPSARAGDEPAAGNERHTGTMARPGAPRDSGFAATVAALSEQGGYFDTDNLVSNETSYLLAVSDIRAHGTRGGAYVGVGPDQGFSYIAALEPEVAYMVDIRRDNLLQHLLFRALFHQARNRAEYLLLLTGREVDGRVAEWTDRPLGELLDHVATAPRPATDDAAIARARLLATAASFGVPLSAEDTTAMGQILDAFSREGLELRFTTFGRAPNADYPTFRQLLTGRDREGSPASYMATERAFRTVQRLESEGLVIPVVGDLAGPHALAAIGRDAAARGLAVSVLYVSNVEYYLMRDGTFDRFATTVAALPRDARSLVIRSCFRRACVAVGPDPGSPSAQLVQPLDSLAAMHERGAIRGYPDLLRPDAVPPR